MKQIQFITSGINERPTLRKLRKLFRSPGLYFRDHLLKRYPLAASHEVPWELGQQVDADPSILLGLVSLEGLNSEESHVVNVSRFNVDFVLRSLARSALSRRQRLWYLDGQGVPRPLLPTTSPSEAARRSEVPGRISLRLTDTAQISKD